MTALTGVYLREFQSIKGPVFLQLDKLCFLYGPNSAGKSSVLDALDLIQKTVSGDVGKYRLEGYYHKNENGSWNLGVGVEILSQNRSNMKGDKWKEFEEWWDFPDQRGDYFHREFFTKIQGKKIQIEFGKGGNSIKVAIDGKPLFELDDDGLDYDDFYKKTEHDINNEVLYGRLTIYKSNKLNEIYDNEYMDFSSKRLNAYLPLSKYFRDLFVEEDDQKLIIRGLNFDAGKEFQTNIVNVNFSVDQIIFPDFENLKTFKKNDAEYQRFIDENFNEATEVGKKASESRKRIYWALDNVARDFEKLIKGFFYQIQFALQYSHVKGDRQLLNSSNCFSFPRGWNVEPKNCQLNEYDPMAIYSRFLVDKSSFVWPQPSIKGDFINKSLKDYLISLRGYEIYPDCLLVSKENDSDLSSRFIFLKVKHKTRENLGFQDVGSGISYIFPILASLWASKLSFIEQPELHLHPSAQCELGDIFISAFNKGSKGVVESHSEHMLLRVLRRIRETTNNYLLSKELKFSENDLRIYYFKPEPSGYTSVKEIRVDRYGELLNSWPGGFFSERDRELFGE